MTFIECENSLKSEVNSLGWYVKNKIEPIPVAVRTNRTRAYKETIDRKKLKKN